jgi:hypothetical protein
MILPLSVAFSIHHTKFPGTLGRQQHAVSSPVALTLRPTMVASFPLNLSLSMDHHGLRRGCWLSSSPLVLSPTQSIDVIYLQKEEIHFIILALRQR